MCICERKRDSVGEKGRGGQRAGLVVEDILFVFLSLGFCSSSNPKLLNES